VGLCLGSSGSPGEGAISFERGTPVPPRVEPCASLEESLPGVPAAMPGPLQVPSSAFRNTGRTVTVKYFRSTFEINCLLNKFFYIVQRARFDAGNAGVPFDELEGHDADC